jgi:hypothetical protein
VLTREHRARQQVAVVVLVAQQARRVDAVPQVGAREALRVGEQRRRDRGGGAVAVAVQLRVPVVDQEQAAGVGAARVEAPLERVVGELRRVAGVGEVRRSLVDGVASVSAAARGSPIGRNGGSPMVTSSTSGRSAT